MTAATGNCLGNNSCNNEGIGPVCGLCSFEGVMTTQGCKMCPPENEIAPLRNIAMALASFVGMFIWLWYSWSPVFPVIQRFLDSCVRFLFSSFTFLKKEGESVLHWKEKIEKATKFLKYAKEKADEIKLPQYFKIYVSAFQVTSCFLAFQVKWPATLLNAMMWLKATINFSILSLPGVSCLWKTISYRDKLLTYTIAPLVFLLMLAIPCILGKLMMTTNIDPQKQQLREIGYNKGLDRFWNAIMFTAFMIYPMVCLVTLEPFNCQPEGLGLLAADYQMECPSSSSFERIWGVLRLFLFIYPIGIPVGSILVLRFMNVHKFAEAKIDSAIVAAMINLYVKRTTTIQSQRIAQFIGSAGLGSVQFRERALFLFKLLNSDTVKTNDASSVEEQEIGSEIRRLKVQIINAKGLPKVDQFGSIDPYCILSCAGKSERTSTRLDTLQPAWDEPEEAIIFDIDEKLVSSGSLLDLNIRIMDWDQLGSGRQVGRAVIPGDKISAILSSRAGALEEVISVPAQIQEGLHSGNLRRVPKNSEQVQSTEELEHQFMLDVRLGHIQGTISGCEIQDIKEFIAQYDDDQVICFRSRLGISLDFRTFE